MFTLIEKHVQEGALCTTQHDVVFTCKKMPTFDEFVGHVLKERNGEWGRITVKYSGKEYLMDYKRGKIKYDYVPDFVKAKTITYAIAYGLQTHMDYTLELK